MTDNEIIKALECCVVAGNCDKCPLDKIDGLCVRINLRNALDLINRQRAEIEFLKTELSNCEFLKKETEIDLRNARAEAVKEFAERLKKAACYFYKAVPIDQIDSLVELMVGEQG